MNYLEKELYEWVKKDPFVFDFLQNTSLDGMWYWDIENPDEEWMNAKFWETLGYDPKEMPHKSSAWQQLMNEEDLKTVHENFKRHCVDPKHPYNQIVRYKHKNGSTVWVKCRGIVIRNDEGKPIRMLGAHINITPQIEAKQKLARRVDRFNQVIEAAEIGTWEVNMETNELELNDEAPKLLGYVPHEIESSIATWRDLIHPKDLSSVIREVQKHLNGETDTYQFETRLKHKDGHWIWVLSRGKIIERCPGGNPIWLRGSLIDITKRKENEILLVRYSDLLERTKKVARIGTWEVDLVENTINWSNVTKQIHEVSLDVQPPLDEAINFFPEGENRDNIVKVFNRAIEKGISYDVELQILTAKNNLRWVRAIGIPEHDKEQCLRVYGLFQDIHERTSNLNKITLQEKLFRQTFDNAPNGMALVDIDGNWLQANQRLCQMLGYQREELLTMRLYDIMETDIPLSTLDTIEIIEGIEDSYVEERKLVHKRGTTVWVQFSASVIRNSNDEPQNLIYQFNDITAIKIANQEINQLLKTTQAQNKRLSGFANIVSHNLRSHSGNLAMLLDVMKIEKKGFENDEFFPMLKQASDGLKSTVQNLHEVITIQTGTTQKKQELNLHEYVEQAKANVRALARDVKVKIYNDTNTKHTIFAVPAYLESILLNLLTNAIKYRSERRESMVRIQSSISDGCTHFSVEDNGLGIDLGLHGQKIFGMYKTFHGNPDARGLGLFLSKSQIEAMDGEIKVESKIDAGTKFSISLVNEEV